MLATDTGSETASPQTIAAGSTANRYSTPRLSTGATGFSANTIPVTTATSAAPPTSPVAVRSAGGRDGLEMRTADTTGRPQHRTEPSAGGPPTRERWPAGRRSCPNGAAGTGRAAGSTPTGP